MDLGTLEALEQIKQLKARYFRFVDTKRWQEWGELFTEG
jgi:3-phenylpropionate/cinnamic acid dioxygenase small subunit